MLRDRDDVRPHIAIAPLLVRCPYVLQPSHLGVDAQQIVPMLLQAGPLLELRGGPCGGGPGGGSAHLLCTSASDQHGGEREGQGEGMHASVQHVRVRVDRSGPARPSKRKKDKPRTNIDRKLVGGYGRVQFI